MKRMMIGCLIFIWICLQFSLTAFAFVGEENPTEVCAVTVAYAQAGELPECAFTGGNTLWMGEGSAEDVWLVFTANEALTNVAFCTMDTVEFSEEEQALGRVLEDISYEPVFFTGYNDLAEGPALGRILWKLPDMKTGDVAYVYCGFKEASENTLLARAAIRFTDAAGKQLGALPCAMGKADDADGSRDISLMPLAPAETGAPVDRDAIEARMQILFETIWQREGEDDDAVDALLTALKGYMDVLASEPWAAWAHLGLAKAQIAAGGHIFFWWGEDSEGVALGAVNAAISMGEESAEAYRIRAVSLYDLANTIYEYDDYILPGDSGWPLCDAAIKDIEYAMKTMPEDFPYDGYWIYGRLLSIVWREEEAAAAHNYWLEMDEEPGIPWEEWANVGGRWMYELEDGGITITGYTEEPEGGLAFPEELNGYPVTGIGDSAFADCDGVSYVIIPESVTSVGGEAFIRCGLSSVFIPDSVISIGEWAFMECCDLTRVIIGKKVTSIGAQAFFACDSLTDVTLPDSVTSIGEMAFKDCYSLICITIGSNVSSIGSQAFFGCESLISVTIPVSVTDIGDDAFAGCEKLTLTVTEGSYAEQYAKKNNIPYVITE